MNRTIEALFDDSKLRKMQQMDYWNLGPNATPVTDNGLNAKMIRQTLVNNREPDYALGGLCSLFTGDLGPQATAQKEALQVVRMDQIAEAVGVTSDSQPVIVIEDSFFNSLTGIPLKDIQSQGEKAAGCIQRWLDVNSPTGQAKNLIVVKTSDPGVENGLNDAVADMAKTLRDPNFASMQAAPILLMYTAYWSKILENLGYISNQNCAIVEPANHLVDDRQLPKNSGRLAEAYRVFQSWLRGNPQGQRGSVNETLGVAGFVDSYAASPTGTPQKRTRLLTYKEVPTTANYSEWIDTTKKTASTEFPFPLKTSTVYAEAVNWAAFNPEATPLMESLIDQEKNYYAEKNNMPKEQRSQVTAERLRAQVRASADPIINDLLGITASVLTKVLGE